MRFVKESLIRASPERVFEFHEQPNVLSLLIPPWESARVIQPANISEVGTEAIVETKVLGLITTRWVAQHTVYEPPLWFLGRLLAPILIQKRLQRLFDYRHEVTRRWCEGKGRASEQ